MQSFLLFILFSVLFVAHKEQNQQIAPKKEAVQTKENKNLDQKIDTREQLEENRNLDWWSVWKLSISCSSEDCPSFVGGLFIKKDEKSDARPGLCSTSLISPSRVLTNAHCIPVDIAKAGSDCEGRIRMVFPKTKDHPSESFHCKRILSIADYDHNHNNKNFAQLQPDWAVLELDGISSRKPVIFRRDGIDFMEPVTIYKVNPYRNDYDPNNKSSRYGQIVRTDCLANAYDNPLRSYFIGPVSALFNVNHCNRSVKTGNSGSAVLDRQGKLIGIVSNSHGSRWGAGTHGACIPLDEYYPPQECEYDEYKYKPLAFWYAYYLQGWVSDDVILIEKTHEENYRNSSSSVLRFSQTPYKLSKDDIRIDFTEEELMKATHRYFLHQVVPLVFPSFPECVDQEAGNSFNFLLSVRGSEVLDQSNFSYWGLTDYSVQLKNKVEKQMIRFEREDDIYWATLADSPKNTFPLSDILGLRKIDDALRFQIPICE